jgi:hypothetical protein
MRRLINLLERIPLVFRSIFRVTRRLRIGWHFKVTPDAIGLRFAEELPVWSRRYGSAGRDLLQSDRGHRWPAMQSRS